MFDWNRAGRVLLIRHDGIGDAVLTTPFIETLKTAVPWAEIYVLARPEVCHLLQPDPHLSGVVPYTTGRADLCMPGLRAMGLYLAIEFRGRAENVQFARATGAGHVASFDFQRTGLADFVPVLPPNVFGFHEDPRHQIQMNGDLLRVLGITAPFGPPRLYLRPEDSRWAAAYRNEVMWGRDQPLVLVHPAATVPNKQWPPERFAAIACWLEKSYGACVVVCGSADQLPILRRVADACSHPIVLAGAPNLSFLAALQKTAHLVIGTDTGPVHMAAAVGTPAVAVFGAANHVSHWRPVGAEHRVVTISMPCGPCHSPVCRNGLDCITRISVTEVAEAVAERFVKLHGLPPKTLRRKNEP